MIDHAAFEKVDVGSYNLGILVENLDQPADRYIVEGDLNIHDPLQKYTHVYKKSGKLVANEDFDAMITIFNRDNNELIYKEKQGIHTNDQGKMQITIGLGVVQEANYGYFNLQQGDYCAEILTPLDYTNPMLMLSLLGVLGLFFAFMLKREDKTSGFGLEKPNKTL